MGIEPNWVADYNGPYNDYDYVYDMEIDSNGNIYVTGVSEGAGGDRDYATIKYDPNDGTKVWDPRYDGTGQAYDRARAMAIDSDGNICITGESKGFNVDHDYATVKYDTNGNKIWVTRYEGAGFDQARAITTDSLGYVYVTGKSVGSGSGYDYVTVKYDSSDGSELWAMRYDGDLSSDDIANAIIIDNAGGVYVTGKSKGLGSDYDYVTIKYDTDNGDELWLQRYNGSNNGYDNAVAMALDSKGNVYVAGECEYTNDLVDYYILRYKPITGERDWATFENGPKMGVDILSAMIIDANDYIYVTGRSEGYTTGVDYSTVKYDLNLFPDGETGQAFKVWESRYNGPASSTDIATDLLVTDSGDVYVTGTSKGVDGDYDYATVRYDSDGKEIWSIRYDGQASDTDGAVKIAINNAGDVYVSGTSQGLTSDEDYTTIKYSPTDIYVDNLQGDFNGSQQVDLADILILAQNWLQCNLYPQQDCAD